MNEKATTPNAETRTTTAKIAAMRIENAKSRTRKMMIRITAGTLCNWTIVRER